MRSRYSIILIKFVSFMLISTGYAFAGDALTDSLKRPGFWHLHQTIVTKGGSGDSHLDQDYDRCIDLRNPPPPKPVQGWNCAEFKIEKTETLYRFQATCTFPNNGSYSGFFEYNLSRSPTVRQETTISQNDRYGRFVKTHLVRSGKLVGACPAGALPISPQTPTIILPNPRER